jgi:predicted solute-binding protein
LFDFSPQRYRDHIRYNLGAREKAGLNKFIELLETHGDQPVFKPVIV